LTNDLKQEAPFEIPGRKPPKTWPENGQVEFVAYKTRYRLGLELVLHEVTCTIKPSEKVTNGCESFGSVALFELKMKIYVIDWDRWAYGSREIFSNFGIVSNH